MTKHASIDTPDPAHRARRALIAAAQATHVEDDPHGVDALPETLALSSAQQTLVRETHFLSDYEVSHLVHVSADVVTAVDESVLDTIEHNATLGGAARAARIRALIAREHAFTAIASIVAPIARLVGQQLAKIHSDLATEIGEPLKVARSLQKTAPHLSHQLEPIAAWTRKHHHAHSAKATAPAATKTP